MQQTSIMIALTEAEQLIVPVRCFGTGNLDCPSQAMRTNSLGRWDHIIDPGIFSLR